MGILSVALGVGFTISAAISFVLSQKMGLLDSKLLRRTQEPPEANQ